MVATVTVEARGGSVLGDSGCDGCGDVEDVEGSEATMEIAAVEVTVSPLTLAWPTVSGASSKLCDGCGAGGSTVG